VAGGEETWHSKRRFRLLWKIPTDAVPAVAAIHYRVLDPGGTVAIGPARIDWLATSIEGVEVPAAPGAYTAEVWFEDAAGGLGAPAAAKLRFDNQRPSVVEPSVGATWIGRASFPLAVRLSHPRGEPPISGIRGYALSVSAQPGHHPCAGGDRCSEAETDLRGGVGGDSYRIAGLPEGVSHVQAVAVSGSGMASATAGQTILRVDKTSPLTKLGGAPTGWVNHPVVLTATAADAGSGMAPNGAGPPPLTAIAIHGGAPTTTVGATVSATVIGEGVHRVAYYARDLAGNVDDGAAGGGPASVLVKIDREPPSVSFANAPAPSEPELIRARVGDSMSGPDPTRGWIGVRRLGSGDRFAPLPRAPAGRGGELRARWDSDAYPAGDYELRAVGYDAAGNATATTRRANGTAMVLSNPLKATTVLRAGYGGQHGVGRAVPYGRGVPLEGRLTTAAGTPLAGFPVQIVERFGAPANPAVRTSTVTTRPGGAFAIRLAPGPSREVAARFAGTRTLSRSSSPALALSVRAKVSLRASSTVAWIGGPPIVFRGLVGASPGTIPSEGKSVQLQFRLPGLPWSEFRTVQTDRRGRFRYAYRFSDDDSRGARFQFRAFAPAQAGWPYEPAGSLPVSVSGR
jgi:hypothetical protein